MPQFEITSPSGAKYRVTAPEGATQEEVLARVQAQEGGAAEQSYAPTKPKVVSREEELKRIGRERVAQSDARQAFKPGTILGDFVQFGDAARASVANTFGIGPRISAVFDDANLPYDERLTIAREENRLNRDKSLVGDITGLVLGGGGAAGAGKMAIRGLQRAPGIIQRVGNVLDRATTLQRGQRAANAAKVVGVGAATGAAQAAGEGTDVGEGAAYGGVGGAVGGYVGSKIGNALEWGVERVARLLPTVRGRPTGEAVRIVLDTLEQDGLSPEDARRALTEARRRGVPMSLSDVGDNMRGLTAGLANKPGTARTIVRTALEGRQAGQAERIQSSIERNLGRTANVREESNAMIDQARADAGPLYDEAYALPATWSNEPGTLLNQLLHTPAGRQAMNRARVIAQNERRDPSALGFDLDGEGNVVLQRVPSMQTLDYVKRSLDDVVEAHRDPVTGRLRLDEAGRAINQVRADFNAELRRLNPVYGNALDAYAGPAGLTNALNRGLRFTNKSADDIAAETERMTPAEAQQYALGVRSALARFVEGKTDGANKAMALVNSPKKRAALVRLFGGEQGFADFMNSLADEWESAITHGYAMTGSRTAPLQQEGQNIDQLVSLFDAGINANNGRFINAAKILLGLRGRADRAGNFTREELARTLTETNPATLDEIMRRIGDEDIQAVQRLQRSLSYGASGGMGAARDNAPPTIDVGTGQIVPTEEPPGPQSMNVSPEFDALASRMEQVESGGNQAAVSPKGAVGVMQVMPTTAPEAAALAGLEFDEQRYLTDPEYNRQLGRAYLAEMLNRFGGDVELAVAAYNAGPGAVQKALAAGDNWKSALPAETQDYLVKVLG